MRNKEYTMNLQKGNSPKVHSLSGMTIVTLRQNLHREFA